MVAHDVRIAKHKPPVSVSSEQDGHVMHVATRAAPALMLIGHRGQAVKQVNAKTGARIVTEKREGKAAGGLAAGHNFVVCGAPDAVRYSVRILVLAIAEHTRLFEKLAAGSETEHEVDVEGVRFVFTGTDKDRTTAQEYLSTLELDSSEISSSPSRYSSNATHHAATPTRSQPATAVTDELSSFASEAAHDHAEEFGSRRNDENTSTYNLQMSQQGELAASLGAGLSRVAAAQHAARQGPNAFDSMSSTASKRWNIPNVPPQQALAQAQTKPAPLQMPSLPHASANSLFATTSPATGAPRQPRPSDVGRGTNAENMEYSPWSTDIPGWNFDWNFGVPAF